MGPFNYVIQVIDTTLKQARIVCGAPLNTSFQTVFPFYFLLDSRSFHMNNSKSAG